MRMILRFNDTSTEKCETATWFGVQYIFPLLAIGASQAGLDWGDVSIRTAASDAPYRVSSCRVS